MARLIDADIFLKTTRFQEGRYPCKDIVEDIESQPTVDAVPVVHGRWIEKQEPIPWCEDDVDVFTVCSICNCCSIGESYYCPNCGAKMDLERE